MSARNIDPNDPDLVRPGETLAQHRERVGSDGVARLVAKLRGEHTGDTQAITLTREQASDHRTYLKARERAEAAGVELEILPDADDAPVVPDGAITITREQARDSRQYEAARDRAAAQGVAFLILEA